MSSALTPTTSVTTCDQQGCATCPTERWFGEDSALDQETDDLAHGWKALHGREYPEDQPETFVFCPKCWEREFRDVD